jgi:hypothetical protein
LVFAGFVGFGVGAAVGLAVGFGVGAAVGFAVGFGVGAAVGLAVGFAVATAVGLAVGRAVAVLGSGVTTGVATGSGVGVGPVVGAAVGSGEVAAEGLGAVVVAVGEAAVSGLPLGPADGVGPVTTADGVGASDGSTDPDGPGAGLVDPPGSLGADALGAAEPVPGSLAGGVGVGTWAMASVGRADSVARCCSSTPPIPRAIVARTRFRTPRLRTRRAR